MRLRPYEASDEAALVDAWFDSRRSVGLNKAEPRTTRKQLADRVPAEIKGRWAVTVAEDGGHIVGFVAVAAAEDRLDQLFVRPKAQGRGVGLALFEIAKAQLPGGFWLRTHVDNSRARAFYERRGMRLDRIEDERAIYRLGPIGQLV